jgi:hypothetical protein
MHHTGARRTPPAHTGLADPAPCGWEHITPERRRACRFPPTFSPSMRSRPRSRPPRPLLPGCRPSCGGRHSATSRLASRASYLWAQLSKSSSRRFGHGLGRGFLSAIVVQWPQPDLATPFLSSCPALTLACRAPTLYSRLFAIVDAHTLGPHTYATQQKISQTRRTPQKKEKRFPRVAKLGCDSWVRL